MRLVTVDKMLPQATRQPRSRLSVMAAFKVLSDERLRLDSRVAIETELEMRETGLRGVECSVHRQRSRPGQAVLDEARELRKLAQRAILVPQNPNIQQPNRHWPHYSFYYKAPTTPDPANSSQEKSGGPKESRRSKIDSVMGTRLPLRIFKWPPSTVPLQEPTDVQHPEETNKLPLNSAYQPFPAFCAVLYITSESEADDLCDTSEMVKSDLILSLPTDDPPEKIPVAWGNIGLRLTQIAHGDTVWVLDMWKIRDTGMMARLLLAEKYRKQAYSNLSLKTSVEEVLGFSTEKDLAQSDWSATQLTKEQIEYAARDAVASLHLYQILKVRLEEKREEIGTAIPEGWYTFNSRLGDPTRARLATDGTEVIWKPSDCTWYTAGRFQVLILSIV
ncbi:hypothetical protein B0H13DRAFT_1865245 [Mycena leptocephala]|nr:hypothetical protein B0H13DRAFT_1865245 [Mycena leptocephala]